MGNTGLLRHEAEKTLLQPHLGDSRHQELRNSPFWPTHLFKSQFVKDGKTSSLRKAPLKIYRVLDPTKTRPRTHLWPDARYIHRKRPTNIV